MVIGKLVAKVRKARRRRVDRPGPPLTAVRYAKLEAILKAHGVAKPTRKQVEHVNKFVPKELEKLLKD